MPEEKQYESYAFQSVSAPDVKEALEYAASDETDFPNLSRLTLDQIDALLHRCWMKGYSIFNIDNELDLSELDSLANSYFNEED